MGNIVYSDKLSCYESADYCARSCSASSQCVYVDNCGDSANAHYACLPFDTRLLTWILVVSFLVIVLCCSALVVFYALRVIRRSFRNPVQTDGDIVFYNARNVHNFPHPAAMKQPTVEDDGRQEYYYNNSRRNDYY
ncbi:hypothetical protein niasHT_007336 [Heterodera trifolii]|uniref:Uncharacterized protein n=1 Tax=Heterodera trifolii TaxID=157864 RepID=A0ABD2LLR5_9BILA